MKKLRKLLILWLVLASLTACTCNVHAVVEDVSSLSPRSNAYFMQLNWDLTYEGGSTLRVYAKPTATHVMIKLGASSIVLYEKRPGASSFTGVYTYNSYTAPSVLGSNKIVHTFEGFYNKAVSGGQYYISVAFYAQDSAGSEYLYRSTPIITVP